MARVFGKLRLSSSINSFDVNKSIHLFKRFNSSNKELCYGFVGLGEMGSRMVNNLITKTKPSGSKVYVYDKYKPSLKDALNCGAIEVSSPSDMSPLCDYIITMLASDDQVNEVYNNIFSSSSIKDNILFIDSSTVNYLTSRHLSSITPNNTSIIDAPVSGGIGAAQSGTLTFMVGGKESLYQNAKENVLQHMGMNIFHAGDQNGSGQIAKICNNLILAISMDAVCEGMVLGKKLGMDSQKLANIINKASGRCWSSDQYNPSPEVVLEDDNGNKKQLPSSNDYNGGFKVKLMRKDLGLALNAAKTVNANTPCGALVSQMYDMIATRGYDEKDFGFMYKFIQGDENNNDNSKSYGS